MTDITAIRAREAAATDGPWFTGNRHPRFHDVLNAGHVIISDELPMIELELTRQGIADAEFIAHARTDVPALLARVDEQAAEIERLRAVAEAVQKVLDVARLDLDTTEEWVAQQGYAEVSLVEAMRALPAVAGQPHYHDPIECGCELTADDAPVQFGPAQR
jgi:hypothetical protein